MNKKFFPEKYLFGFISAFVLTAFTVYALLDTFVIERRMVTVEANKSTRLETALAAIEETESQDEETDAAPCDIVITDDTYSDGEVDITVNEYRAYDTTIYVADVYISSPEYLFTAFANNVFGRNVKDETSSIASDNGAIIAINGDFYGSRNSGYVIRNGVLYRSVSAGSEDLVIWSDGSFGIIDENEITAEELLDEGAVQVFSFGPALVVDGEVAVSAGEEVGKAMASNPRTAIAIVDEGHYLFIVSDGRTNESEGLSLLELAEFSKSLGAEVCYNLDGGGSSTMYFLGEVLNNPTTNGHSINERSVSDIIYVG
ncbi:MAG: phosphodiester glycosidase family protein [Clostridia bacterium]|nr:phosphodiester glycosidase family protein [Clostridia bacterium]